MPKRHDNTIRKLSLGIKKIIKVILSSITRIRLIIYIEEDTKVEETTVVDIIIYLFYLLPDSVPFSGPCRLLPIYIGKVPTGGKNLGVSFQLVLRVPPSPSLYICVFCLPCVLCFLGILEDLGGREVVRESGDSPVYRL